MTCRRAISRAALLAAALLLLGAGGTFRSGRFTLEYQDGADGLARSVAPLLEPEMLRVCGALNIPPLPAVRVEVANRADVFLPHQADPFEPWVAGMADPGDNTIFLRPLTGAEVRHNSLHAIIAHELAHLAINARVQGNHVPTWLDEGLAMFLAHEPFYARADRLAVIALTGRAFMFRDLQHGFPSTASDAETAYAQAGDFVRWLHREHGEAAFNRYLDILAQGVDPDKAIQAAFGWPLYDLQQQWMKSLGSFYNWIPVLTGGSFIWFLLALVSIFVYYKKLRAMRQVRASLAAEEEANARLRELQRERKKLLLSPAARRRRRARSESTVDGEPEADDDDGWEVDPDGLDDDGTFGDEDDDEDWEDDDEDDDIPPPSRRH